MKILLRTGFYLLTHFIIFRTLAQTKSFQKHPESQPASLAIRLGLSQLYGDLKDQSSTFFGGASLVVPITKTVAVELPVDAGRLQSQQEDFYHSISKTRFTQLGAVASADLLQWFKGRNGWFEFRPYAGAGLVFFRAEGFDLKTGQLQRLTNNENSHRSRDGIEAKGKAGIKMTHELVWIVGMRGSTALSPRMSIFGDLRLNLVRTDKLDATLDNINKVMTPGSPAYTEGNHYGKNSNDKWGYAAVGLNFYFGERYNRR
ncbi:hypothetical protein [Larkinella terrae]|uniref:DUF3575 domain-containing protein n=1 Tax=Larkinella terrae TaxID=2025311 RepID=A0A7K0EM89_9BACT|nr:hypothetical protein [Larkinella terrae]MRS62538.1 hypothetical protein [Larkinella terrae]